MSSSFTVVEGSGNLPARLRGSVVAIGNFDGVHKGHQYLLHQALLLAQQLSCSALVFTFEPHPIIIKNKCNEHHRLTTISQKYKILDSLGFDGVVEQRFDNEFMQLEAKDFIDKILVQQLAAKAIVVGNDFCFGKERLGDSVLLNEYASKYNNFILRLVDVQKTTDLHNISSSYIRQLLCRGLVDKAAQVLNYHYTIENVVVHGAKLGRKIGFPTINMELSPGQNLAYGIYAVKLKRANGDLYEGVASFGKRPTVVEEGKPLLETYIFNFNEEIYGEYVRVSLFEFLREERKFENLDQMIKQIKLDVKQAEHILKQQQPLSQLDKEICF